MLDATGKGPEDLGNHRECRLAGPTAQYCVLMGEKLVNGTIPPVGEAIPIAIGVCAPISCNVTELADMFEDEFVKYGLNSTLMITGHCGEIKKSMPAASWVVIGFVGFLGMLVLVGSVLDYLEGQKKETESAAPTASIQHASEGDNETDTLVVKPRVSRGRRIRQAVVHFLIQFSLPRNVASWAAQGPGVFIFVFLLCVPSLLLLLFLINLCLTNVLFVFAVLILCLDQIFVSG